MRYMDNGAYGSAETFFGTAKGGRGSDEVSLYASKVPLPEPSSRSLDYWGRPPSFDVSNNVVACSCSVNGMPRRLVALSGRHSVVGQGLPGVYVHKELQRVDVAFEVREPYGWALDKAWQSTTLWHGLFPKARFALDGLEMTVVTFAPVCPDYSSSPRGVLVLLEVTNHRGTEIEIKLEVNSDVWDRGSAAELSHEEDACPALLAVSSLTSGLSAVENILVGNVAAASTVRWAVGLCIGVTDHEMSGARAGLSSQSPEEWLAGTERELTSHVGIPATEPEGYDAALLVRQIELCRQSLVYGPDGLLAGGFWGSDVNDRPEVWMRDNFYAALALAWFAPRICADAAQFYAATGWPERAWGRGVCRFGTPSGAVHSVGNAVAAVVLAGAYLRATGDVAWLRKAPLPYEYGVALFDSLDKCRSGPDDLFPSLYISDGDARGDWHTGSNILAWRALTDMAEMADYALGDSSAADRWREWAVALHAAILGRCTGPGPKGPQFFEGGFADGSYVAGHDGEESDLTLASYYGFTDIDDPLVIRHAQLAFSADNPMYWAPLKGVQWWDSAACFGPTFPAYVHQLCGAETEGDLGDVLRHLRTMADIDGSFWWWPYRPFCKEPSKVERGIGKAGWAAGVLVCRLINDIFGLQVNALTNRMRVRPFCPWNWHWANARLGTVAFDAVFETSASARHLAVRNQGSKELEVQLEVIGPSAQMPTTVILNGEREVETWAVGWHYSRRTVTTTALVQPGRVLELQCSWSPEP